MNQEDRIKSTTEELPAIDEILENPVEAGLDLRISMESIPPDEEVIKRKIELIKNTDPTFLKELVQKYLADEISPEIMENPGEITLFLTKYFPDVNLTRMKPFSEKSIEEFYQPECVRDCIYAKDKMVEPIGYLIKTPVSLLRIEGCYGSIKRCRKKIVQVMFKGIRAGKGHKRVITEDLWEKVEEGECLYADAFETCWEVLHGKTKLWEVREYLKSIMLFGIERVVRNFEEIKIPEKGELISEVFVEEKVPGIFVYPIQLGEGCGLIPGEKCKKERNLCLDYFSKYWPECLRYNYYVAIVRDRDNGYHDFFCMVENCNCGSCGNPYDVDKEDLTLNERRLADLDLVFSFDLARKITIKFGLKNIKDAIKLVTDVLRLLV